MEVRASYGPQVPTPIQGTSFLTAWGSTQSCQRASHPNPSTFLLGLGASSSNLRFAKCHIPQWEIVQRSERLALSSFKLIFYCILKAFITL